MKWQHENNVKRVSHSDHQPTDDYTVCLNFTVLVHHCSHSIIFCHNKQLFSVRKL